MHTGLPRIHGAEFEATWRTLEEHAARSAQDSLQAMFTRDANRFGKLSFRHRGLLVDHSKQHITSDTLSFLIKLAENARLDKRIAALFGGERVNTTEDRAAQHMALRRTRGEVAQVDGSDPMAEVLAVRRRVTDLADRVRSGTWRGFTGQKIDTVINIGIGGSDLGPRMVCTALQHLKGLTPHVRFVANVDPTDLARSLVGAQPANTLFVITSKTFTTQETLANANTARAWMRKVFGEEADLSRHLIGITASPERAAAFGIARQNIFPFWDWVGGRYSLWSAVGLPIALTVGARAFEELLAGAADMDQHFATTPFVRNLPVLHALIGIWNSNFQARTSQLVIPYLEALSRLPAYLQQLEMESNGKSVDLAGDHIDYSTCPALWGEPGTNSQHAFFQWLHQGTGRAATDFIVAAKSNCGPEIQHQMLLANALAQSRALMVGRKHDDPHRSSAGGRPSSTIVLPQLTPFSLGQLIALYEHKVFVQGVIWGINSFDQFGVELGKEIANQLLPCVTEGNVMPEMDSSTAGLLAVLRSDARSA